jgi:hypothetical protein
MPRTSLSILLFSAAALGGVAACYGSSEPSSSSSPAPAPTPPPDPLTGQTTPIPAETSTPSTYVAKVKNILVGLPPTDDEVKLVEGDPAKLGDLIDTWMALPQYETKMRTFFELAFQQTQVAVSDFADQVLPRFLASNGATTPLLVQNTKESFARTVLELGTEGRPFTESMSTTRFMMTPALMELYAFLDAYQVDDAGKVTDGFRAANPTVNITVGAAAGPVPIAESLDPKSPNFMHWYNPDVVNIGLNQPAGCAADPVVYPGSAFTLHTLLFGSLDLRKNPTPGGATCGGRGGTALTPQLTPDDFTTWKMVTVRAPSPGEPTTLFYDLPTLRSASELVLTIPRVGFFSTPAFFANWQTNTSNQARVTANQMLIVALGAAVDGTDPTAPKTTPGLDATHAANPACFACHQTLDPTRSILASTYSWNYHRQAETSYATQKGLFAFQGVEKPVASVADLGEILATHPLLPAAWVQKLCYYVNSTACSPDDPELLRIVDAFKSSGYSWSKLVRALMASPIVTNATATKSSDDHGEVVAVTRRDHLCAALNARLGFADVCGLDAFSVKQGGATIPEIVSGLPSDGYGRGALAPVLPNQPTLFFRAGIENICDAVAALVIDAAKPQAGVKQWSSAQPDVAIADFVHVVMALPPSDTRAAAAQQALTAHFAAAKQQSGVSASDALKSTFVVSCLAPSAIAIGL